jgi:hypothetical protein
VKDARHRADFALDPGTVYDKQGLDEIGRSQLVLTDELA